jgi:hypothetical protein
LVAVFDARGDATTRKVAFLHQRTVCISARLDSVHCIKSSPTEVPRAAQCGESVAVAGHGVSVCARALIQAGGDEAFLFAVHGSVLQARRHALRTAAEVVHGRRAR